MASQETKPPLTPNGYSKKNVTFGQWCLDTTCHGVADFYRSSTVFGKAVWVTLILISFILMISNLSMTVTNFMDEQKRWVTTIKQDPGEGLEFPVITICNYNRVRRSMMEKFQMDERMLTMLFNSFTAIKYFMTMPPGMSIVDDRSAQKTAAGTEHAHLLGEKMDAALKDFTKWKHRYQFNMSSILRTFGHQCDETIVKVWSYTGPGLWGTDVCQTASNATIQVKELIHGEFGLCHQLNVSNLVKGVTMSGASQALHMVLDIQLNEYLPFYRFNYMREGLAVQLSYDGQVNYGEWVAVAPGFFTQLGIKQSRSSANNADIFNLKLFDPPCAKTHSNKFKPQSQYSKLVCEDECIIQVLYDACGCLEFVETEGYRMCEVEEILACQADPSVVDVFEQSKVCRRNCQDGCDSKSLEVASSMTRFVTKSQMGLFQHDLAVAGFNLSEDYLNSMIMMDIFYTTMQVQVVERYVRITLDQLVSNIGGQMGIWAGMSVLTVWQAVIYSFRGLSSRLKINIATNK